ncbi:MAG: hypothetical protein IMZ62_12790 [Chloroflexi bacterium]|nr:hypothetical protein [Chloroflexota bacterium]MBE3119492.1 hypothetical protein [Candidatus Atribacteria bacterium]
MNNRQQHLNAAYASLARGINALVIAQDALTEAWGDLDSSDTFEPSPLLPDIDLARLDGYAIGNQWRGCFLQRMTNKLEAMMDKIETLSAQPSIDDITDRCQALLGKAEMALVAKERADAECDTRYRQCSAEVDCIRQGVPYTLCAPEVQQAMDAIWAKYNTWAAADTTTEAYTIAHDTLAKELAKINPAAFNRHYPHDLAELRKMLLLLPLYDRLKTAGEQAKALPVWTPAQAGRGDFVLAYDNTGDGDFERGGLYVVLRRTPATIWLVNALDQTAVPPIRLKTYKATLRAVPRSVAHAWIGLIREQDALLAGELAVTA